MRRKMRGRIDGGTQRPMDSGTEGLREEIGKRGRGGDRERGRMGLLTVVGGR